MSTCTVVCTPLTASRAACLNLTLSEMDTVSFWVQLYEPGQVAPVDLTIYDSIEAAGELYNSGLQVFQISTGNGIIVGGDNNNRLTFTVDAAYEGKGRWDCAGIIAGEKHFLLQGNLEVRKTITRVNP